VPWLRRLVAGLSSRRSGFDTGSVHVRFVVDKVALGQVFSNLSVFPCQFHSTGAPIIVILGKKLLIFITEVAQEALRLRYVRSICCGALHHATKIGTLDIFQLFFRYLNHKHFTIETYSTQEQKKMLKKF
jgi:hypothetical protein